MLRNELIGKWICTERRFSSQTVTVFHFFGDGAYSKSVERSIDIPTPYGPVEESLEGDTDEGTWAILSSGRLQLTSEKAERSVVRIRKVSAGLVIDSQEFTRAGESHALPQHL